ncbi:hypothetical protein ACLOJK_034421 [Asimina triloba]
MPYTLVMHTLLAAGGVSAIMIRLGPLAVMMGTRAMVRIKCWAAGHDDELLVFNLGHRCYRRRDLGMPIVGRLKTMMAEDAPDLNRPCCP